MTHKQMVSVHMILFIMEMILATAYCHAYTDTSSDDPIVTKMYEGFITNIDETTGSD